MLKTMDFSQGKSTESSSHCVSSYNTEKGVLLFYYQDFREETSFTGVALNQILLGRSTPVCKNNRLNTDCGEKVKCKRTNMDHSWFPLSY